MPKAKKVKVLAPTDFTKVDDKFVITLRLGDKTYKSEGESILDALQKFEKPPKIFLKGILTLSHGEKKTKELVLTIPKMKRLFYPIAQFHQAKMLNILLK